MSFAILLSVLLSAILLLPVLAVVLQNRAESHAASTRA